MDSESIRARMQAHLDDLTKPQGSLGELEAIGLRLASIQGRVPPKIGKKLALVVAADHGVATRGVSLFPQEVTTQMVANFLSGGAAINVLARTMGYELRVIDAGVIQPAIGDADGSAPGTTPAFEILDVRRGSGDITTEDAMTADELESLVAHGERVAQEVSAHGYELVALGDMGIGNTTVAAAILAAYGHDPNRVVDRGTGVPDEVLERKRAFVTNAAERCAGISDAKTILRRVGGLDGAFILGFILGLRGRGIACVLDGFPITTSAYHAFQTDPSVVEFLFAGHKSRVRGHQIVLNELGLEPIVDLKLRLGEGSGAVIGGMMVSLAAAIANEMSTFSSAGVSESKTDGTEE